MHTAKVKQMQEGHRGCAYGRTTYNLRHVQHHTAEICFELHRRGLRAPEWQ